MIANWLAWAQAHKEILSVISSCIVALGTVAAALMTAARYLDIYRTHVAMDFFRRYSEISLRMPDRLRLSKLRDSLFALPPAIQPDEWRAIARFMIEYGNLCSEEFELYKQKRIPTAIWKMWRTGIKENFESPVWREAWRMIAVEYVNYRDFFEFMEEIMAEAAVVHIDVTAKGLPPSTAPTDRDPSLEQKNA